MAPVRRYLKISKYSVLECRIYLDNPALVQTWLLNPRNPILPRVIESVRPLVLPKLREERERSKKKGSKKKGIKDVVVQDGFEVSIFLTETNTRHSLLTKHKHFRENIPPRLQSNTNNLIGNNNENALTVEDDDRNDQVPIVLEEDSDEHNNRLDNIPLASDSRLTRPKRRRNMNNSGDDFEADELDETAPAISVESDPEQPPQKRLREDGVSGEVDEVDDNDDDKKKLAMDVSYEGFSLYGRVLCLVVRKTDNPNQRGTASNTAGLNSSSKPAGQANMNNWITSTQIPVGEDAP